MVQVLIEPICSQMTGVYGPKPFIPHAASLHQACAHCEKFSTAATRRCLDRVSVPVWLVVLSDQATRLSLGKPLPYQLADRPRLHEAPGLTVPSFEDRRMPSNRHIRY